MGGSLMPNAAAVGLPLSFSLKRRRVLTHLPFFLSVSDVASPRGARVAVCGVLFVLHAFSAQDRGRGVAVMLSAPPLGWKLDTSMVLARNKERNQVLKSIIIYSELEA